MILIVYAWIFFALLGLIFAVAARQNAKDELSNLDPGITNGRRRLGRGHVRDETIVGVIDFVWAVLGIVYLAGGETPSNPLIAVPLIGTSALLAFSTLARWLDRRYAARPHDDANLERDLAEDAAFGKQRRALERQHLED